MGHHGVPPRGCGGAANDPVRSAKAEVNPRLLLHVLLRRVCIPGVQVQYVLLEVLGHAAIRRSRRIDRVSTPLGGRSGRLLIRRYLGALADTDHPVGTQYTEVRDVLCVHYRLSRMLSRRACTASPSDGR